MTVNAVDEGELRCICQICTCGQHRCQIHGKKNLVSKSRQIPLTQYQEEYVKKKCPVTRSFKVKELPLRNGIFTGISEVHDSFRPFSHIPKTVVKVAPKRQSSGTRDAFAGDSTYRSEYTKKHGQRAQRCLPLNTAAASSAPLEKLTTHLATYREHKIPPIPRGRTAPVPQSAGRFLFKTTNQVEYPWHKVPQTARASRPKVVQAPGRFTGKTVSQTTYLPPPKRKTKVCPVPGLKPKPQTNTHTFYQRTTSGWV